MNQSSANNNTLYIFLHVKTTNDCFLQIFFDRDSRQFSQNLCELMGTTFCLQMQYFTAKNSNSFIVFFSFS